MGRLFVVPYGPPGGGNMGNFVMHVNPAMQNRPPPNFQLSNCKLHIHTFMAPIPLLTLY